MKPWHINKFYGGFALDDKLGLPSQFGTGSRGLDIYTEPGKLRPHKIQREDETNITDAAVSDFWAASDSKVYAIGQVGGGGADDAYTRLYVKTDANAAWGTAASGTGGTFAASRLWEYNDKLYWWGKDNTIYSYGLLSGTPAIDEAVNTITATDQSGPMIEQKGNLYVTYDNHLASFDGTTWVDDAFDLPTGWLIKSLTTWGKYIAIAAYYKSGYQTISRMFFWDTSATSWEFAKDLPRGKVAAIRNIGDRIVGITTNSAIDSSDDGTLTIFEWAGGAVNDVYTYTKKNLVFGGTDATNRLNDAEVDVKDNVFYFASDLKGTYHGLYSWGATVGGQKAFNFDRHLRGTNSTLTSSLAAKFIAQYLYCSILDTADYVVTKTTNALNYGTAGDGGIYESLIFDGRKPYLTKEIKSIIINCKPLPSNPSITLKYDADRTGTFTSIGSNTTAGTKQIRFDNIDGTAFNTFNELQLRIEIKTTATSDGVPEITDITTLYNELEIKP